MKKIFITAISLQGTGDLEKGIYQPDGFMLENNCAASFPIIPIISEHMDDGEDIKIIALRTENDDAKDNYIAFTEQLAEMGIREEQVVPITIEENQSKVIGMTMLMNIIDEIPQQSVIYADITYGTKPMAFIIFYALNCIEKIRETEVAGIYYGELPRVKGKSDWGRARLYDLTAYKYLSDIIDQLQLLGMEDMRELLHRMFDM